MICESVSQGGRQFGVAQACSKTTQQVREEHILLIYIKQNYQFGKCLTVPSDGSVGWGVPLLVLLSEVWGSEISPPFSRSKIVFEGAQLPLQPASLNRTEPRS